MVVARTERSAAALSAAVSDHSTFTKEYLAVLHGIPREDSAVLEDYLYHDARARKTAAVSKNDPRGKLSALCYRTVYTVETAGKKPLSLVAIRLKTGRTHQIRAQFSAHGHPLAGDGRYGARDRYGEIALFSAHLSFLHPKSGKRLSFTASPERAGAFSEFPIFDSIDSVFERSLPDETTVG
jgi:23S rRNA pseudouridine1911/1915/1917 synthase